MAKRRNFLPEFKAKVALAAIHASNRQQKLGRLKRFAERGKLTPNKLNNMKAVQMGLESPSYPGCTDWVLEIACLTDHSPSQFPQRPPLVLLEKDIQLEGALFSHLEIHR